MPVARFKTDLENLVYLLRDPQLNYMSETNWLPNGERSLRPHSLHLDDVRDLQIAGFFVEAIEMDHPRVNALHGMARPEISVKLVLSDGGWLFLKEVMGFWQNVEETEHSRARLRLAKVVAEGLEKPGWGCE